jgi:hypothetical protein
LIFNKAFVLNILYIFIEKFSSVKGLINFFFE